MKTDLQLLIKELEKEYNYLRKEQNRCAREWDFHRANAFRKALIYTGAQHRILLYLHEPNYDHIESLKKEIESMRKLKRNSKKKFAVRFLKDKITELQRQLTELEQQAKAKTNDDDKLLECIEDVINHHLQSFQIRFEKYDITLELARRGDALQLEVRSLKNFKLSQLISKPGLAELQKMGFLIAQENALLLLNQVSKKSTLPILTILSRITYDVLGIYGIRKAAILCRQ